MPALVAEVGQAILASAGKKRKPRLVSVRGQAAESLSEGLLFIGKCEGCGFLHFLRISLFPRNKNGNSFYPADNRLMKLFPEVEKTFNFLHSHESAGCGWHVSAH
ncbi:MAG: hypothetical protein UY41_C0040G0015 [Candidatus Moranbacteria bacterium GW2011_GWE1_49_15]|nr:MAG: hypothetical protein UY41_C0040G0015 [Candidatus Moranbacteria bacterium GW2011_GWE1_49_15]